MVSPVYLFLMFLIGFTLKLIIWLLKISTNLWVFKFLYKRTNWLYLHVLGTFFALTFTNYLLHCFICFKYLSTLHWVGYISIIFGMFLFILLCGIMIFCIAFKIVIWTALHGKYTRNDEIVDYMFPHLLARHMIQTHTIFFFWRWLVFLVLILGWFMGWNWGDFIAVALLLTIQHFAFKAHLYWKPYKDFIYFLSMILTEFAVVVHGVCLLIFTSPNISYNTWYIIGFIGHAAILVLIALQLPFKY